MQNLSQREREIARAMQKSPIFTIRLIWGLEPQPVKDEYAKLVEDLIIAGEYHKVKPEYFHEFIRGNHYTWQQYLILSAVELAIKNRASRKISIRSGHGIGKSTTMSWLIIWFLICYPDCRVPCTAPTGDQLHDVLWTEIRSWISKFPDIKWLKDKLEVQTDKIYVKEEGNSAFARARTARKEAPEALAGLHAENMLMVVDEACFDEYTEILTENGFRFFKDLKDEEKVLSMNEKGEAIFDYPRKIMEYNGSREMYYLEQRGCNFAVTSNHKMLYKTRNVDTLRLKEIKELDTSGNIFFPRKVVFSGYKNDFYEIEEFRTSKKIYKKLKFKMEDWVEFMAWWLSEGCIINSCDYVSITQSSDYNPSNCKRIENLLDRMNLKYSKYKSDYRIRYRQLANELKKYGEGFKNKHIPSYIKHSVYANLFLDVFALGDGYFRKDRRIFYTSSKTMSSDIQEMLYLSGSAGTINVRKMENEKYYKDHYIKQRNTAYVITERIPNFIKYSKKNLIIKEHTGTVYCVETKYGNIFTRRFGKCMWSGNSGVDDEIYKVAKGAFTEKNVLVLLISNPTRLEGYFYRTHHQFQDKWQTLNFSTLDSPLSTSDEYAKEIAEEHGLESDEYRIRVLGEFPKGDSVDDKGWARLLELFEVKNAQEGQNDEDPFIGVARMGIDPAGEGTDISSWVVRDKFKARIVARERISTKKGIAEKTLTLFTKHPQVNPEKTYIDNFGVGAEITKEIAMAGVRTTGINVGDKANNSDLYINLRAEAYMRLRRWVQSGGKLSPSKDWEELTHIRFRRGLNGKVQIMSKRDMKSNGYKSPNNADALMMTFIDPEEGDIMEKSKHKVKQFKPNYSKVSYNKS